MSLAPGIHHDIASDAYHADPAASPSLSASTIKVLLGQSPLHAWHGHPKLNPAYEPTHSDRFDFGTCVHLLVLEGEEFAGKVATIDAPDWRTKAAQAHRDAARAAGLVPLLTQDWERVRKMALSIHRQIATRDDDPPLFADGKPEVTIVWEERGVQCRARLDWLRDDFTAVDDLKSTSASANPHDYSKRTFWSIGCDVQSRLYQRGVRALTGIEPAFRFVVAETQPPYAISVLDLAPSAAELADAKIDLALEIWKRCVDSGIWPSYPSGVASVETAWQELDFFDRYPEAMTA